MIDTNTKLAAFDLEIVKPIPEGDSDWKAYRPLGISCAAIAFNDAPTDIWFPGCQAGKKPGELFGWDSFGGMDELEKIAFLNRLFEIQNEGYTLLTWNGLSFDFDILAEETGYKNDCEILALTHVDPMFQFFCHKGFPVSLEAAAQGQDLGGKLDGMNGADVPILWAKGPEERLQCIQYVGRDASLTVNLAERLIAKGHLSWKSQSGRWNSCEFPNGLLTVAQCLSLPEPDTSWMSNPMPRSKFTDWIDTGSIAAVIAVTPQVVVLKSVADIRLSGSAENVGVLAAWMKEHLDILAISTEVKNREDEGVRQYISLSKLPNQKESTQ